MIAVVKQNEAGEIVGWMFATDSHDMRRRAMATGDHGLAEMFYKMEFPPKGKTQIAPGITMLVE